MSSPDSVLAGRVVLVTGVTGQIGWGAAHAARDAGARVVLPVRSTEAAERAADEFGGGAAVVLGSGHHALDPIGEAIEAIGRLDHVVAPIGAWWSGGATIDQPSEELVRLLDDYVVTQHRLLRIVAPALRRSGGSYTLVTGAVGEATSIEGSGLLLIAVKAQFALADNLRRELAVEPFRFNEFRIRTRVERDPRPGVVPSRTAGEAFVELMSSDRRSELVRFPDT